MEPAGVEVPIIWRGRRAKAFVPELLAHRDLALSDDGVGRVARAQAAVEHGAEAMPEDYAALARLLLRAEGVASSFVEGVTAPVVEVVLAEASDGSGPSAAAWIAANLAAVTEALGDAHAGPLTVDVLCGWHRTLMTGSPTPAQHVGVVRTEQGWIGGTSPVDAHLVTPPPEHLPGLLDDLVEYANRTDVDAVSQAAIAHAQFEGIHPFADGNGRVGRVLIAWILARRLSLVIPPPVSTCIAADVGGYGAGLVSFRLGEHERWVRWFADAVSGAGRQQQDLITAVGTLLATWESRLHAPRTDGRRLRSNAAAWRAVDLVPRLLVLTAPQVADELAIPLKSARAALRDLEAVGILAEVGRLHRTGRGRPRQLFVSPELLGLVGSNPLRA
jgi:Fic family protein